MGAICLKNNNKKLVDYYNEGNLIDALKEKKFRGCVAFYVHGMCFSKGGIEKLAAQLANKISEIGWKVYIYCRAGFGDKSVYALYNNVDIIPFYDENKLDESSRKLIKNIYDHKVDVFIPMLSEWIFSPVVDAASKTGVKIIASEHNDPWIIEKKWWNKDDRINCFSKVDRIHLLLEKFVYSLPSHLHKIVSVIPNGVDLNEFGYSNLKKENIIVSVGRLTAQKRFDRLVEAVSYIAKFLRKNNYKIHIYGDGELRGDILNLIKLKKVDDLVELKGISSDIPSVLQKAKIFVLPSEFEGFSIATVEALCCGLPVVAFKSCNGPNEIVVDNESGYLVETECEFAKRIEYIINHDPLSYSDKCLLRGAEFSTANFYDKWINLIESAV